ncbi:NAD-binding protein [Cupriavidus basilensis]
MPPGCAKPCSAPTRSSWIGGGFLGLETASAAVDLGLKVTVLESAGRLLGRAAPAN